MLPLPLIIIGVELLEKFTRKGVITPDSEEGGVITPDFTSPVKVAKNPFFTEKILKISGFGRLSSSSFLPISFGGESEGTPESLSFQKYGLILVWSGSGPAARPQILSGFSSPAKSLKIDARLPENTELIHQFCGDLVVRSALQPYLRA